MIKENLELKLSDGLAILRIAYTKSEWRWGRGIITPPLSNNNYQTDCLEKSNNSDFFTHTSRYHSVIVIKVTSPL